MSKFSKKSQSSTVEAMAISHATAQAAHAAKAILNAGGSELTALKTAKAAAMSALMPEPTENEISSAIGSSFLRRRKLKRQADVVASMALASALAGECHSHGKHYNSNMSAIGEWDTESRATLEGLKIINEPVRAETLSTKESSSHGSNDEASNHSQHRPSPAEMIAKQFKLIPKLASALSGGSRSKSDAEEELGQNVIARQVSSFSEGISERVPSYSPSIDEEKAPTPIPSPRKVPPKKAKKKPQSPAERQQPTSDKRVVFRNESGSLGDDLSVESDMFTVEGPADSIFMTIVNAITCAPILGQRQREARVRSTSTRDGEAELQYEETVTFDEDDDKNRESEYETDDEEEDRGEDADIEHDDAFEAAPRRSTSTASESNRSAGTDASSLHDLMADLSQPIPRPLLTASRDRNTIELQIPSNSDSVDELTMGGASSHGSSHHDGNASYVQIIAPPSYARNRRLTKIGSLTPTSSTDSRRRMFRNKWRK